MVGWWELAALHQPGHLLPAHQDANARQLAQTQQVQVVDVSWHGLHRSPQLTGFGWYLVHGHTTETTSVLLARLSFFCSFTWALTSETRKPCIPGAAMTGTGKR